MQRDEVSDLSLSNNLSFEIDESPTALAEAEPLDTAIPEPPASALTSTALEEMTIIDESISIPFHH